MINGKKKIIIGLASRLKDIRIALKLTQEQFSDELGISNPTIVRYEAGSSPSVDVLIKLNENYNVNLNWLVSGQGNMFVKGYIIDFLKKSQDIFDEDKADLLYKIMESDDTRIILEAELIKIKKLYEL